ncbi:MAG TPA: hydroxyisourate hydrolase [Gemmatimonadaceae bacterium]|nr:hydroxyisourate hydrolase [Gemmatimonadaceae bacterium]
MITTHVLDVSTGKPAAQVRVSLSRVEGSTRKPIGAGLTDADGRLKELVRRGSEPGAGVFELQFETGPYFRARGVEHFHPHIIVVVEITDPKQHYHVPLLVSPFGYTTYRGT